MFVRYIAWEQKSLIGIHWTTITVNKRRFSTGIFEFMRPFLKLTWMFHKMLTYILPFVPFSTSTSQRGTSPVSVEDWKQCHDVARPIPPAEIRAFEPLLLFNAYFLNFIFYFHLDFKLFCFSFCCFSTLIVPHAPLHL